MLKITVVSLSGKAPPQKISALFDESGGSIGRAPDNRMILPDPTRMVSRVHVEIVHRNGQFFLLDRGSNPARYNGEQMDPGKEKAIADGDRIQIGAYLVQASFSDDVNAPQRVSGPSAAVPGDAFSEAIGDLLPATPRPPSDAGLEDLLAPPPPVAPSAGLLGGIKGDDNAPAFDALGLPIERAAQGGVDELFGLPGQSTGSSRSLPVDDPLGGLMGAATVDVPDLGAPSDPLGGLFGQPAAAAHASDPLASLLGEAPPKRAPKAVSDQVPELHSPFKPPTATATPPPSFTLPDDAFDSLLLQPENVPKKHRDAIDSMLTGITHAVPPEFARKPAAAAPIAPTAPLPHEESSLPGPPTGEIGGVPVAFEPVAGAEDFGGLLEESGGTSGELEDSFAGLFDTPAAASEPVVSSTPPLPPAMEVSAPEPVAPAPASTPTPPPSPRIETPTIALPTVGVGVPDIVPSARTSAPQPVIPPLAPAATTPPDISAPQPVVPTPPPVASAPPPGPPSIGSPYAVTPAVPPAASTSAPQPAVPAQPATPADELLAALLQGIGYTGPKIDALTPELLHRVGVLLREATQGTVDLLAARSATKREVRANATMIMQRENNPLKFSPNADAALAHLLQPDISGFMGATEAMRDAYLDLRAHQFGVMAGMRSALSGLLQRFLPANLEQRLSTGSKLAALLPMARRAQLWEAYLTLHQDISQEAEDNFHALFGREFLRAYEEQIARFKPAAPSTPRPKA